MSEVTSAPTKESKDAIIPIKGADSHKKIANHLEAASKHHLEAAKHHDAGDLEKAALSTIKAQGHVVHASDAQREISKSHSPINQ
jgi:hypothetical protein